MGLGLNCSFYVVDPQTRLMRSVAVLSENRPACLADNTDALPQDYTASWKAILNLYLASFAIGLWLKQPGGFEDASNLCGLCSSGQGHTDTAHVRPTRT